MTTETMPTIYIDPSQKASAMALIEQGEVLLQKAEKYDTVVSDGDAEVLSELRARMNKAAGDLDKERLEMTAGARETVARLNDKFNARITPMKQQVARLDSLVKKYLQDKEAKRQAELRAQREQEQRLAREREEAERKAREQEDAARRAAEAAQRAAEQAAEATSKKARAEAERAAREAEAARQKAEDERRRAEEEQERLRAEQERNAQAVQVISTEQTKSIAGTYGSTTGMRDNWVWELEDITKVPEAYLLPPVERLDKKLLNTAAKSKKDKDTIPGIRIYNDPIISSRTAR